MGKEYFKEFFWYHGGMILTDLKDKVLVFDEFLFFSEAKKYLINHFSDKEKAISYLGAFNSYLTQGIAVSFIHERVNFVMKFMYDVISNRCETLNEYTEYTYPSSKDLAHRLHCILSAFCNTSEKRKSNGKLDISIQPAANDENNLIVRLIYYEKDSIFSKLFLKESPKVRSEMMIEVNSITQINGNSNELYISMLGKSSILKITPFSAHWVKQ